MTIEEWLGAENKLGIDIWHSKYQHNGETLDEWFDRVSGGNKDVRRLIEEKKFLFGGRILANRGVKDLRGSLANCYCIAPPEDSIESIYKTCSRLARTYSYGGGCGIDISKLAPRGAKVNNSAGESSGAVSFMDTFSQVTGQISQAHRRGALMISIDCHHPDLEEFIDIKTEKDRVQFANISVRITDDFMRAVRNNDDWTMSFTRPETGETITRTAKARYLFHKFCENNWNWAEPGMLYWDTINRYAIPTYIDGFEYAGTNPCKR